MAKRVKTVESTYSKITLTGRNKEQKEYINTIRANEITFCAGLVGTGKTYIAAMSALIAMENRSVDRIILSRPIVPCGSRTLGYLKGTLMDKFAPYLEPYIEIFNEQLGASQVEGMLASGRIAAKPFEYIRGQTFRNAYVLLDEAQNTTIKELEVFIGRIGEGCTVIVTGDIAQKDIREPDGLAHALNCLQDVQGVGVYMFPPNAECVRNPLITEIMKKWQ